MLGQWTSEVYFQTVHVGFGFGVKTGRDVEGSSAAPTPMTPGQLTSPGLHLPLNRAQWWPLKPLHCGQHAIKEDVKNDKAEI